MTKEGGFVSFFFRVRTRLLLESGERGDEDDDFWLRLSELACWTAGEMECPTSYIDDEDGANGIYNADSGGCRLTTISGPHTQPKQPLVKCQNNKRDQ